MKEGGIESLQSRLLENVPLQADDDDDDKLRKRRQQSYSLCEEDNIILAFVFLVGFVSAVDTPLFIPSTYSYTALLKQGYIFYGLSLGAFTFGQVVFFWKPFYFPIGYSLTHPSAHAPTTAHTR